MNPTQIFLICKDLNIFRKLKNKTKANGLNRLAAQWHSTSAAGWHNARVAHSLVGWPRTAGHEPAVRWPSGGRVSVQRAHTTVAWDRGAPAAMPA
jgi:hypothetical protein